MQEIKIVKIVVKFKYTERSIAIEIEKKVSHLIAKTKLLETYKPVY